MRERHRESDNDREATREREIPSSNTSNQGRVRGGQRESDTDKRGNERERDTISQHE